MGYISQKQIEKILKERESRPKCQQLINGHIRNYCDKHSLRRVEQ